MTTQSPSRFTYGGLSSLRTDGGSQTLLLVGDQGRAAGGSAPRADVVIKDPVAFRESLSTLLEIIEGGFGYSPSSPEVGATIQESYERWKQAAPQLTPIESRREFHKFMADSDPAAWLVMDPLVTIGPGGILFEVFDRAGRVYGAYTLRPDAYEGETAPGTLHIEAGLDLLHDLALLTARSPLRLRIGADAAEGLDEKHKGDLEKAFSYPLYWQRQLLQMLAAAALPGRQAPLARVDLYNVLRYLRLHREGKEDDKALRFALVPGEPPELTLEPWGWRYRCTGPAYRGEQSELIGIWDRREPMLLERVLPYVQLAQAQILGEAQPTFWTLDCKAGGDCGSFSFTLATPGFRASNWSRGLMMDILVPRHTPAPAGYDAALAALAAAGSAPLADLAQSAGVSADDAAAAVRRAAQEGLAFYDPAAGVAWHRPLLPAGIDREALLFRSGQEGKAWRLVEQGRVEKNATLRPTGEIDFVGPPDAANPDGKPSVVTEPKHPFQEHEPRFTPKMELNRAGATRKPGCTCTYWKRQSASTKAPCAHLQALWLRHSLDLVEERALEKTDPSRIKVRNSTFVKRLPAATPEQSAEEIHEISLVYRRLSESWGTRQQLRDQRGRRQVLIFPSVDAAREAYLARCAKLEQKGFLNASK